MNPATRVLAWADSIELGALFGCCLCRSTKPEECPGIARSCLALLCCLSSCTQGLPPLDTCDMRLWARVGNTMAISTGWEGAAASLRGRLSDSASELWGRQLGAAGRAAGFSEPWLKVVEDLKQSCCVSAGGTRERITGSAHCLSSVEQ
jgi:hypothetical protein